MLNEFKKTKKQKQVSIRENCDKLNSLSKKENFIVFKFNDSSKTKLNVIIINDIKNLLEAEILNLSSIKPKEKIKKDVRKKRIKSL